MTACQHGEQVIIEELLTQGENELITEKIDVNAVDNVSTEKIIYMLLTKTLNNLFVVQDNGTALLDDW